MDLQPGPFLQGTVADVTVTKGVYDFTSDAEAVGEQLTAIYHDWDAFLQDLPLLAAGPADPRLGINDLDLISEIANETAIAAFPGIVELGGSLGVAFTLLGGALSFAPTAAFSVPTDSFVPPDPNATLVVPKIPISYFTPGVTGLVGQPNTANGISVELQNLTRVGQEDFVVGDTAVVTVIAGPGQEVAWDPTHNGVDLGQAVLGTTDTTGRFTAQGTFSPDQVGGWSESWYVDGQLITTFNFLVVPSGE